jgi:hypothetical protein
VAFGYGIGGVVITLGIRIWVPLSQISARIPSISLITR